MYNKQKSERMKRNIPRTSFVLASLSRLLSKFYAFKSRSEEETPKATVPLLRLFFFCEVERIVRVSGMTMNTLLYFKWVISKDLLYRSLLNVMWQGTLLNVMWQPGSKGSLGENGYM